MAVLSAVGNSSTLLVRGILTQSRGSNFLCFLGVFRGVVAKFSLLNEFPLLVVELHELIVVTNCEYRVDLRDNLQTPGLALVVRCHEKLFLFSSLIDLIN
jgi:hypothetical protein